MEFNIRTMQSRHKRKWSERDTLKFVELYEAEDVLWDVRLRDYKNKYARSSALERVARCMDMDGVTSQEIKLKMNNIRTTYTQEKLKIIRSLAAGAEDVYVPTVPWFNVADRFLSGVVKSRKIFDNSINKESDSNQSDMNSPDRSVNRSRSPGLQCWPGEVLEISTISPGNGGVKSEASPLSQSPDPLLPETKAKKHFNVNRYDLRSEQFESIKHRLLSNEVEDEFSHFGKNVACQLRQIPVLDALDLQSEILEMIKRKRKEIYDKQKGNNSLQEEETSDMHLAPTGFYKGE